MATISRARSSEILAKFPSVCEFLVEKRRPPARPRQRRRDCPRAFSPRIFPTRSAIAASYQSATRDSMLVKVVAAIETLLRTIGPPHGANANFTWTPLRSWRVCVSLANDAFDISNFHIAL